MKNRLKLDFSLETAAERQSFILEYMQSNDFPKYLTQHEQDTIADYLLWGKESNGLTAAQNANVHLSTHWDKPSSKVVSLDELLESPTFDENIIQPRSSAPLRRPREVFSREETRKNAPAHLLPTFEELWDRIDRTDLLIEEYDRLTGKKDTPIRPSLLSRFAASDIEAIRTSAANLSQYQYLKKKRQLVELRTEQYTIRDSYAEPILIVSQTQYSPQESLRLGVDVQVRPFGLRRDDALGAKIFRTDRWPAPQDFSEDELREISNFLWDKKTTPLEFDFCKTDHLYKLFEMHEQLASAADASDKIMDTLPAFWATFEFYKEMAGLNELQRDILDYKVRKWPNQKIADTINAQYGKGYNANYISTIFCQKILESIADAASYHREIMENIFFEENFKTCIDCGRTILLSARNFVRKAKSKDGFSPRCKQCEKLKRNKYK